MDSVMQIPPSGMPDRDRYLVPKEIWHLYCRSYSTFMKRLNEIVREGEYREGAFRVIPQRGLHKRRYNQIEVHPVWGIEVLNKYFDAANVR